MTEKLRVFIEGDTLTTVDGSSDQGGSAVTFTNAKQMLPLSSNDEECIREILQMFGVEYYYVVLPDGTRVIRGDVQLDRIDYGGIGSGLL